MFVEVRSGRQIPVALGDTEDRYIQLLAWQPDGLEALLIVYSRDFKRVDIVAANRDTGALLSAVPVPEPGGAGRARRQILRGDVPSPTNPPPACRFHTRCPKRQEVCTQVEPPLERKDGGNVAACHFPLTDAEAAERTPTAGAA